MGTNWVDEKWVRPISAENEEEDDEEALSLCDLPINEENQSRKEEEGVEEAAQSIMKTQEEFDFGSRGGFVLTETEMCAADEVFFQGQILPLRYYASSKTGSAMPQVGTRNPIRSSSGSGSMDCSHSSGLTSVSSRSSSSSIRSQHSSSSGSRAHEKRLLSQFLSQPSSKPKIRLSIAPYGNVSHHSRPKSTRMSFFRVGLVRTPGIELQDLKLRSNSNRTRTSDCDKNGSKIEKKKMKRKALFRSCKCSVDAVETVPLMADDMLTIRSRRNNDAGEVEEKEDEKVQAMKKKKKKKNKKTTTIKKKQTTSHRRTCEWLKELSLAGGPDEA